MRDSVAAIACSIAFGISVTLTIGAVCYLLLIPAVFVFLSPGRELDAPGRPRC